MTLEESGRVSIHQPGLNLETVGKHRTAINGNDRTARQTPEPQVFISCRAAHSPGFENADARVAVSSDGHALFQGAVREWNGETRIVLELGARSDNEIDVLACERTVGHSEDPRGRLHDHHGARPGFDDNVEGACVPAAEAGPQRQNLNQRTPSVESERSHDLEWRRDLRPCQLRATAIRSEHERDPPAQASRGRPRGDDHAASNRTWRRIQSMTPFNPSPFLRLVKITGLPPRTAAASRAITFRSAPTLGARSILLITSRSLRVTPGPPFRGTLSPPATSTT